ncbi:MAG: hypothetical protein KAR06_00400 [Deltaproteobacteria bacterium]|nr:hypothetical protein [Deltaproteobacteria bacterium]
MTDLTSQYPPVQNYPVMMDSGAYTAWTKKVNIDINDYIEFLHKYEPYLRSYVNLDKIPAEYGRKATPEEVKDSARVGFENLLYMRDNGLDPIPVFHYGEDFSWLKEMIDVGCEYIGISPTTDKTTSQKRAWLDKVFNYITDSEGRALVKTHAFGVTAIPLLVRYPWYTADSTSWIRTARFGGIFLPKKAASGEYDYGKVPLKIDVSGRSPSISEKGGHYETAAPAVQRAVDEYLESLELGHDYAYLKENYTGRDEVCAKYFCNLEKNLPAKALDRGTLQPDFFAPKSPLKGKGSLMKVKLIFATGYCGHTDVALTNAGAKNRLLSYYYHGADNVKEEYLPRAVALGVGRPYHKLHRVKLRR